MPIKFVKDNKLDSIEKTDLGNRQLVEEATAINKH